MIDNLEKVLPFLKFESSDDFYYLQILQRKKENPQLGSNSRVIKNYYITSQDHLRFRYAEIKQICEAMNARAMIRLNKRSFEKVAFKNLVNLGNTMMNKEYKFLRQSYDRACGLGHNDKVKKWILDIDSQMTPTELMYIEDFIQEAKPEGRKTLAYIPSKAGLHLITLPFDSREFQKKYPEIEIQRDNPTNLYIP
jgi:hypothetical protein